MNTIKNLLINLCNLLVCACELFRYALIFLLALFSPKAVLAAGLPAVESGSLLVSTRSCRGNADGQDSLKVFASYGQESHTNSKKIFPLELRAKTPKLPEYPDKSGEPAT